MFVLFELLFNIQSASLLTVVSMKRKHIFFEPRNPTGMDKKCIFLLLLSFVIVVFVSLFVIYFFPPFVKILVPNKAEK